MGGLWLCCDYNCIILIISWEVHPTSVALLLRFKCWYHVTLNNIKCCYKPAFRVKYHYHLNYQVSILNNSQLSKLCKFQKLIIFLTILTNSSKSHKGGHKTWSTQGHQSVFFSCVAADISFMKSYCELK